MFDREDEAAWELLALGAQLGAALGAGLDLRAANWAALIISKTGSNGLSPGGGPGGHGGGDGTRGPEALDVGATVVDGTAPGGFGGAFLLDEGRILCC